MLTVAHPSITGQMDLYKRRKDRKIKLAYRLDASIELRKRLNERKLNDLDIKLKSLERKLEEIPKNHKTKRASLTEEIKEVHQKLEGIKTALSNPPQMWGKYLWS